MASIFSNIFGDSMKSLFTPSRSESVLGIDIGSSSVKVVELKKKGGKAVLETYGSLALGTYGGVEVGRVTNLDVDKLSQATLDLLKESNAITKLTGVGVPSSASLIFIISLPGNIEESALAAIIPNEARKYIPVPISEVSLDWSLIPRQAEDEDPNDYLHANKPKEAKTDVLVVAIHNETVTRYKDVLKKTALEPAFFEMEVFSTIRATFSHEFAPVLLIDFGASKTKLSIVEYGIVRTFHIVNRGSQDITLNLSQSMSIPFSEAETLKREIGLNRAANAPVADSIKTSIDYIFNETNAVVLAYEKKYNKTISKVILCGGGVLLKGFLQSATANFHAEVAYGNPFSKTEAPAFLTPVLETSGPEFATAVGLALRQLL